MRIWQVISAFLVLVKTPDISASAADDITCCKIEHFNWIELFSGGSMVGGSLESDCNVLRKKFLPTRERALVSMRYNA